MAGRTEVQQNLRCSHKSLQLLLEISLIFARQSGCHVSQRYSRS